MRSALWRWNVVQDEGDFPTWTLVERSTHVCRPGGIKEHIISDERVERDYGGANNV